MIFKLNLKGYLLPFLFLICLASVYLEREEGRTFLIIRGVGKQGEYEEEFKSSEQDLFED